MKEQIKVPAQKEELPKVQKFIEDMLEAENFPMKTIMQIDMAVEELFINIVLYAYRNMKDSFCDRMVTIDCSIIDDGAEIIFADQGEAFDPLTRSNPDVTLSAEDRKIGGLGIFMVKKSMDLFSYERRDNQNIVKIYKKR